MPVTLNAIRTDVRNRLSETSARYWTDSELDSWINEAARDIARRCEVLQDRQDITAISGTQEYALPESTLRIHRVEYRPTGSTEVFPLEYRDFNSMDSVWWTGQSQAQSTPRYFTLWGFPPSLKLIVFPKPQVGGTFKVFYYRLPTVPPLGTSNVEIPEGWQDAVALYCEYTALRKDADPRWQEAKQLYEHTLTNLYETSRRWADQAGAIETETSWLPQWLIGGDW